MRDENPGFGFATLAVEQPCDTSESLQGMGSF